MGITAIQRMTVNPIHVFTFPLLLIRFALCRYVQSGSKRRGKQRSLLWKLQGRHAPDHHMVRSHLQPRRTRGSVLQQQWRCQRDSRRHDARVKRYAPCNGMGLCAREVLKLNCTLFFSCRVATARQGASPLPRRII